MATKKSVAKKTAVPAKKTAVAAKKTVAKSAPVKAPAAVKAPMPKMTKTQVIRQMAEQLEVSPKQIGAFFDLLIEIATTETRKAGEFTIPGLGKAREGPTRSPDAPQPGDWRIDQDRGEDDREVPSFQGCQGCCSATKEVVQSQQESAGRYPALFPCGASFLLSYVVRHDRCRGEVPMTTRAVVNTQDVTKEYKAFLAHTAKRIKELRRQRGLTLRDMVVVHGYHDSNWRRMEREGVGSVQSLLRIATRSECL